jgi:hypothetical protein
LLSEVHLEVGGAPAGTNLPALTAAPTSPGTSCWAGRPMWASASGRRSRRSRRDLDAADLRWPVLALDDLSAQLDAYAARTARYPPSAWPSW